MYDPAKEIPNVIHATEAVWNVFEASDRKEAVAIHITGSTNTSEIRKKFLLLVACLINPSGVTNELASLSPAVSALLIASVSFWYGSSVSSTYMRAFCRQLPCSIREVNLA
jgi:hypothetical protein